MFQLRHLRTFLAAAETRSFTRAGERVHLSQPAVTEQIRGLESALDRQLFQRHHSGLSLTEAGETLVHRARELLALADETMAEVRGDGGLPAPLLRVAAPGALCAGLLAPLGGSLPGPLRILEAHSTATAEAVASGAVELGVVHGWPQHRNVDAELIARDWPAVVMPVGHALAAASSVTVDDLAVGPLLLTSHGCRYRTYLDGLMKHGRHRPRIRAEVDGVPSLLRMVRDGLGIAVLPSRAIPAVADEDELLVRPLKAAAEGLPICALVRRGAALSPRAAAFLVQLRKHCASDQAVPAFDVQHRAGGVSVADQE